MRNLCLRGVTWNHSRAFPPLVAASQRFEELHPQLRVVWEKRSLDEFGHAGLETLANSYDLLIIDHPMLGQAHDGHFLVNLQPQLPAETLAGLEADALGPCLASYRYKDCLYALPVDAAAPAASYRPDLLERKGYSIPTDWKEVIALATRGLVRMPGFPADIFLNLMGMCVSRGSSVARGENLFDHEIAARCLEEMKELASFLPETIYGMNPIALYESMTSSDEFAYCPFAYTYSNYSRPGFSMNALLFTNPVTLPEGAPLRTVLGGAGIAVSAKCANPGAALDFCTFVSSRNCQTYLYGVCGGQPASKSAWHDPQLNSISNKFFERTSASVWTAYVRPRYAGYVELQRTAGALIIEFLRQEATVTATLEGLDTLYRRSLPALLGESEVAP